MESALRLEVAGGESLDAELAQAKTELQLLEDTFAGDPDANETEFESQKQALLAKIAEIEERQKTAAVAITPEVATPEAPPQLETKIVEEGPPPPDAETAVTEAMEEPSAVEAAVAAAVPEAPPEERKRLVKLLRTPEAAKNLGKKVGSFLKSLLPKSSWKGGWKEILAGGAAGAATRYAIRAAYGSNIWWAAGAGAAGGAMTGAVREILVQRKRLVSAADIRKQLEETKDMTKATLIVTKAEEAYKNAWISGDEEDVRRLAEELRTVKEYISGEVETESHLGEKERILSILKHADKIQEEIPATKRKEVEELLKTINFERGPLQRRKIAGAAMRGALVGAVGGAVGGALASWISEHINIGGAATEEVILKKTEAATRAASQELQQELLAKKAEVSAGATARAMEKAQEELLTQKFSAAAEKGEGATHVARKLIHDYLANQNHLNPDEFSGFSTEQLVWAEDALQRTVGTPGGIAVQPEMRWEFTGNEIKSILEKARGLSEEQMKSLSGLLKDPAHRLSSKTLEFMTNWEGVTDEANNFWSEAREAAEAAGRDAAAEAQATFETTRAAAEEITTEKATGAAQKAMNATLMRVLKYGGVAATAIGVGVLAKKKGSVITGAIRERLASRGERKGGAVESTLGIGGVPPPTPSEIAPESDAARPQDAITQSAPAAETAPATSPEEIPKTSEAIEKFEESWRQKGVIIRTNVSSFKEFTDLVSKLEKIEKVFNKIGIERLKSSVFSLITEEESFRGASGTLRISVNQGPEAIQKFLEENLPSVEQKA
ncbi:hypothetical protein C4571_03225 [Candidatus Parcubacteria bacterium]|nr:MAG: hypothetical protein C4571_03225 [Candidatus Parcubacteria bacterium]